MTEMYQITGNIKGEFACYLGGSLKGDWFGIRTHSHLGNTSYLGGHWWGQLGFAIQ